MLSMKSHMIWLRSQSIHETGSDDATACLIASLSLFKLQHVHVPHRPVAGVDNFAVFPMFL
jgi:hypothetical protein